MLGSLRLLRHRDFALIWTSALASNIGNWMQIVAVGVLVTAGTGQARWAALVATAGMLPMALLAPVGGVCADRFNRRAVLLATTSAETAATVGLAVVADAGEPAPAVVTLLVLVRAVAAALGTPAFQAMLPDLVPREELPAAISLNSVQFNVGRVLGPAAAGAAIAAGGYVWAFGLNAASFGAVLLALVLVRLPARAGGEARTGLWRSMADGARTAAGEPGCRSALLLISAAGVALSPFIALIPAFAVIDLASGPTGTSALTTAQGLGAVAGAFAVPLLMRRFGRPGFVVGAGLAASVLLVGYALAPNLLVAVPLLALAGAAYVMIVVGLTTVVQARAPAAARGRVLGLFTMLFTATFALGALAQGAVADGVGLRAVTVATAVSFAAGLTAYAWRRPDAVRSLGDPPEGATETGQGASPAPKRVV
jgi:MFS family permease